MSSHLLELLDLSFRWVHVIAGIMWIGNSLLFNWLDRNLRPSARGAPELYGDIWLLHSGAFYFVEKTSLAGQPMPRPLHWFKWQAYTTWLSGAALLLVVYYLGGRALLTDPSKVPLAPGVVMTVGLGSIVVGWLVYDMVWTFVGRRSTTAAAALSLAALVAMVISLTSILSGRAAFLHVGALLATIMAANVAMTIVPSQRQLVASVGQGRGVDESISARAKRVSIHNNYFTFPVIALMVSSHFPAVYGHRWNWLLLLVIVASGAGVRHVLNVRFTYPRWKTALAATMVASVVALFAILSVSVSDNDATAGANAAAAVANRPVSFDDARRVIDRPGCRAWSSSSSRSCCSSRRPRRLRTKAMSRHGSPASSSSSPARSPRKASRTRRSTSSIVCCR